MNHNKILLKIPKNLKAPIKVQRAYCNYLWFKQMNRHGIILKSSLKHHKNRAYYWSKILIGSGWMEDCGDYFRMNSYQKVWELMGVEKVNKKKGVMGYAYAVIDGNNPKDLLVNIQKYIVERVKRQIVNRLSKASNRKAKIIREISKPVYSCKATARALGYKSDMSGCRYRKRYMRVIKPDKPGITIYLDHNGVRCFKYPAYSICLK